MEARNREIKDGRVLLIREAAPDDARAVLDYVEDVSRESDYLSFGPGELGLLDSRIVAPSRSTVARGS